MRLSVIGSLLSGLLLLPSANSVGESRSQLLLTTLSLHKV